MERRTLRQFGFAAIPVVLLAQCAPQCAPACTPMGLQRPIYTTVGAQPEPANWTASTDGRYLGAGDPTVRLDVDSLGRVPTAIGGQLSGDASTVVGVDDSRQVVRVDVATGGQEVLPPLPPGWDVDRVDTMDDAGRKVVLRATNDDLGIGILQLDRGAVWIELGPDVGPNPCLAGECDNASSSADGSVVAFDVAEGEDPAQVWAATPNGPRIVTISTAGGEGNDASATMDITPDGHYVLFWSEATNLVDGGGDAAGRLYVRDLWNQTTTLLPVVPTSNLGGSISADGMRVAFIGSATVGGQTIDVASVFDQSDKSTVQLTPTATPADAVEGGPVEISANGQRVIWNRVGDATSGPVIERVDFV
jgi:hypothetical protein